MLTNKVPQDQNQTTSYTSSIGKQIVKGLALIGLCAAGMYGVAQWVFLSVKQHKNATEEDGAILVKEADNLVANHPIAAIALNGDSQTDKLKEQDLVYQISDTEAKSIIHQNKFEDKNVFKFGDIFPIATNLKRNPTSKENKYLAKLANGNLVIVWQDQQLNIKGGIFNNRGAPVTDIMQLSKQSSSMSNSYTLRYPIYVAGLSNSNFAVFWINIDSRNKLNRYIVVRTFDSTAVAISDEVKFEKLIDGFDLSSIDLMGVLENSFALTSYDAAHRSIEANIFDNHATHVTRLELVANNNTHARIGALNTVSCGRDKFAVVWSALYAGRNDGYLQIFNAKGEALSSLVTFGLSTSGFMTADLKVYAINESIFAVRDAWSRCFIYDCYSNRLSVNLMLVEGKGIYAESGAIAGIDNNGVVAVYIPIKDLSSNSDSTTLNLKLYTPELYAANRTYVNKQYSGQQYQFNIGDNLFSTSDTYVISLSNNFFLASWVQYEVVDNRFEINMFAKIFDILMNTKANAFYINFTDDYLQNVPYTFSHTMFDCLNCKEPIIFDALLSNPQAGELATSLSDNTTITTYNTTSGLWHVVGSNNGINTLLKELTYTPAINYVGNFSIYINIADQIGPVINGTINMVGVPIHYPPAITTNRIVINQGERLVLTEKNLSAASSSTTASQILFHVSNVQHGNFTDIDNNALTSFSQQQVQAKQIVFIHYNTQQAPAYLVIASDGTLNSTTVPAGVFFNIPPQLKSNQLTIHIRGEKVVLNNSMLSAMSDNPKDELIFIFSNIKHGQFELASIPGKAIITFTQTQIDAGSIVFIHDGTDQAPSFDISLTDGMATTTPVAGGISFYPSVTNNDKPQNILPLTLVGTGIGVAVLAGGVLGIWSYRKSQALAEERKKFPLADALRAELRLTDVNNFQSEKGLAYLNAISHINDALQLQDIDVDQMSAKQIEQLAKSITRGVKETLTIEKTCTGARKLDFNEFGRMASLIIDAGMSLNNSSRLDNNEIEIGNIL